MKLVGKRIAFRADASLEAGSGHVMRCLTLADALREQGAECRFICRVHPGHLADLISARGHRCYLLATLPDAEQAVNASLLTHASWLGCSWKQDAAQTLAILTEWQPDWLVVDHYALDAHWERILRPHVGNIMAIDDLADRSHECDLLLDQNLGRQPDDYQKLIPHHCTLLVGPRYALLRPEFAALREYSLLRRKEPQLHKLLITMGGVDQPNATGRVLGILKQCDLTDDCHISVVMGTHAPWLEQVRLTASTMQWDVEILVGVNNMAQRMADCDLAIGAAGSTSWERCCLGVPTLMAILARNQLSIGNALYHQGGAVLLGSPTDINFEDKFLISMSSLNSNKEYLKNMCTASAMLTDGSGCHEIIARMI